MIRISQLKLPAGHSREDLEKKITKTLRIRKEALTSWTVVRRSLDARKKPDLFFVYTVDAAVADERTVLKKSRNGNVQKAPPPAYRFPEPGTEELKARPVVAGFGPAGIFAAYMLALHGYRPLVIERGSEAQQRKIGDRAFGLEPQRQQASHAADEQRHPKRRLIAGVALDEELRELVVLLAAALEHWVAARVHHVLGALRELPAPQAVRLAAVELPLLAAQLARCMPRRLGARFGLNVSNFDALGLGMKLFMCHGIHLQLPYASTGSAHARHSSSSFAKRC